MPYSLYIKNNIYSIMRYLKSFNESSTISEIVENILDICLELTDEGFGVNVENQTLKQKRQGILVGPIRIKMQKKVTRLVVGRTVHEEEIPILKYHYSDVKEVVMRIIEYVKSEKYLLSTCNYTEFLMHPSLHREMPTEIWHGAVEDRTRRFYPFNCDNFCANIIEINLIPSFK
jgi:hypothetical protein